MVAVRTGAVELVHGLVNEVGPTGAAVLAGVALAADQLHRAVFAAVFRLAGAEIIRPAVGADPVLAGAVSLALVDLVLAVITLVTFVALASVAADTVHARARLAGVAVALVDIHLAILAGDPLHAETLVSATNIVRIISILLDLTGEERDTRVKMCSDI